jgi:hypothetical protein
MGNSYAEERRTKDELVHRCKENATLFLYLNKYTLILSHIQY